MCSEFVCTLSKTCINEPVCDTSRCPYVISKSCDICMVKQGCKSYKRPSAETSGVPQGAPSDPLSPKR